MSNPDRADDTAPPDRAPPAGAIVRVLEICNKKGLLENAANLCAGSPRATAVFDGQSAVSTEARPAFADPCKKARKGSGKKRSGHGGSK